VITLFRLPLSRPFEKRFRFLGALFFESFEWIRIDDPGSGEAPGSERTDLQLQVAGSADRLDAESRVLIWGMLQTDTLVSQTFASRSVDPLEARVELSISGQ